MNTGLLHKVCSSLFSSNTNEKRTHMRKITGTKHNHHQRLGFQPASVGLRPSCGWAQQVLDSALFTRIWQPEAVRWWHMKRNWNITHRIHIYHNMDPINIPPMLAWILWVILSICIATGLPTSFCTDISDMFSWRTIPMVHWNGFSKLYPWLYMVYSLKLPDCNIANLSKC